MKALQKYVDSLASIVPINTFEVWKEGKRQITLLSFPGYKETKDCKESRQKLLQLRDRGYEIVD